MAQPTSLKEIDLTPIPGKQYFNLDREWREEFIYFLMVDRFHDDTNRKPVLKPDRCQGVKTPDDFYGAPRKIGARKMPERSLISLYADEKTIESRLHILTYPPPILYSKQSFLFF